MNVTCPYCERERCTNRIIGPGIKVRCPSCKNVFTPVPVPTLVEELAVLPDSDPEPPPPPRAVPPSALPPKTKQLHGPYFKPMEASRRSLAIVLTGGLIGLLVLFVNWYTYTVKTLDVAASKAAQKRGSKIKAMASSKAILIKTAELPKVPVVVQQPLPAMQQPLLSHAMSQQPTMSGGMMQVPLASQQPTMSGGMMQVPPAPQQPTMSGGMMQVPPAPLQAMQSTKPAMPNGMGGFGMQVPPSPPPMVPPAEPVAKNFNPAAEKKADSKLYQAQKLEKEGKLRLAAKLYQEIIDQFPDTEAAKTAENKGTKVVDHRVDMAQEQLAHAEAFERINNFEEAKAEYEGVISRYPETEAAKTARSRLTNLKTK